MSEGSVKPPVLPKKNFEDYFKSTEDIIYNNVLITPKIALEMLDTMDINRKLYPKYYTYARAMKKGEFKKCTVPISFSKEGHLIDGQHRLYAIIESEVPIKFAVEVGLDKDTVFDRGLNRTLQDEIVCRDLTPSKYSTTTALSMVNSFLTVKFGRAARRFTTEDRTNFINDYSGFIDIALKATGKNGGRKIKCRIGSIMAAILGAAIYGVDPQTLNNFCEVVNTGYPIDSMDANKQSSAITFRKYLDGELDIARSSLCSLTETALWDFAHGKQRKNKYKEVKHMFIDNINIEIR